MTLKGFIFLLAVTIVTVIVGETNLPALVAADASALSARNVLDFLKLVLPKDATALAIDKSDDIVAACLVTQGGQILRT